MLKSGLISILMLVIGFGGGFLIFSEMEESNGQCSDYSFINPRFKCGNEYVINKKDYAELKGELIKFIEDKKNKNEASIVSVYFRDLEAGPTMGIDERIDLIPASLLKLPIALAIMGVSEEKAPNILSREVAYTEIETPFVQGIKPEDQIQPGKSYTIEELINYSLANSDNVANELLLQALIKISPEKDLVSETYRDLGILHTEDDLNDSAVNTKSYGSIFRQLYNISFLNPDLSEKILSTLSLSKFKNGLRRGVPENIIIAHKFGERFLDSGEKQLHDCGIIYYPENPYLLCIMTRGNDFEELADIIGSISEEVYNEVNSRRL